MGGGLFPPPFIKTKGCNMDVITLKNTEFPKDFMTNLDHDQCIALLNHLVTEKITKIKCRLNQMSVTLRDGDVSFDFHLEVIGGMQDGLVIVEPFIIQNEMDLKSWLQQMSCLGCKVWEWGFNNHLTFLEGWDVAAATLVDANLVAFQIPDGYVLFHADNVIYSATCFDCLRPTADCWTAKELEDWMETHFWVSIPDGRQTIHYCRKCVKKIIKF